MIDLDTVGNFIESKILFVLILAGAASIAVAANTQKIRNGVITFVGLMLALFVVTMAHHQGDVTAWWGSFWKTAG